MSQTRKIPILMNGLKYCLLILNIYTLSDDFPLKKPKKDLKKVFIGNAIFLTLYLIFSIIFTAYFIKGKFIISLLSGFTIGFALWGLVYNIFESILINIILYAIIILTILANIFTLQIIPFGYSFLFIGGIFMGLNLFLMYKAYTENELYEYDEGFWFIIL